ncbi:MAG: potassium channel family protein [Anaerolineae bacterium]
MYILIANKVPLGRHVASALVSRGHEVAYVDESLEYCNLVSTELGCLTIEGEPTNLRVLQSADIERADAVIALLDEDIENILVGLFARQFGVPRIVAVLTHEHYRAAYELAGIENVRSSFDFLFNEVLIAVENPIIRRVMAVGDGRIEIAAIDVIADSPLIGQGVEAIFRHPDFPRAAMVLGLLHAGDRTVSVPRDAPVLRGDDEVLVVGTHQEVQAVAALMGHRRRGFLS